MMIGRQSYRSISNLSIFHALQIYHCKPLSVCPKSALHQSQASVRLMSTIPHSIGEQSVLSSIDFDNNNKNTTKKVKIPESLETIVLAKQNIPQSPWKMRFLIMLIREAWYPDALAQMKFTPKVRSDEITKMLKRGAILAKIRYDAIPEELRVKEVIVSKGLSVKRLRIMGRGRTGMGYKRCTNVRLVLEKISFPYMISKQKTITQKRKWMDREKLIQNLKVKSKT